MTLSPGKMNKVLTLIRMFRWPNLLMMAAGLLLTRYFILQPVYSAAGTALQTGALPFLLLLIATLAIGAGGYVVNDILDTGLDELNKPGVNPVGRTITEKQAWTWYYVANGVGLAGGGLLSYLAGKPELGILFVIIATALYYYSLKYKYLPFWGNFVVALLTAMTVLIVWLFEFFFLKQSPEDFILISTRFAWLNRLVLGYSILAFYISFIREVAKDAQDRAGDQRFGCRTLPIVLGDRATRMLLAALFLLALLLMASVQAWLFRRYTALALFLTLVDAGALWALILLLGKKQNIRFSRISLIAKAMLAVGLLSMIFLYFPN